MPAKLNRMSGWVVDRELLAWAAGFVDGEGSFYLQTTSSAKRPNCLLRPRFEVAQVDSRILHRLKGVLGFGAGVNGPYDNKKHSDAKASPIYTYSVSGFEDVQTLMALLWTWLGPVKREQAKSVLMEVR